jgi:hypothetical protein
MRDIATGSPFTQALRARKEALYLWGADLAERAADIDARLWEPNYFYARVYRDEIDALRDGIRAWRLEIAWLAIETAREKRRLAA